MVVQQQFRTLQTHGVWLAPGVATPSPCARVCSASRRWGASVWGVHAWAYLEVSRRDPHIVLAARVVELGQPPIDQPQLSCLPVPMAKQRNKCVSRRPHPTLPYREPHGCRGRKARPKRHDRSLEQATLPKAAQKKQTEDTEKGAETGAMGMVEGPQDHCTLGGWPHALTW